MVRERHEAFAATFTSYSPSFGGRRRPLSRCHEQEGARWFPCAASQRDAMLAVGAPAYSHFGYAER